MLNELLNERKIMPIWEHDDVPWTDRKKEIVQLLCEEEYGFLPPDPIDLSFEVLHVDQRFCAGKAPLKKVMLTAKFAHGSFSFPVYAAIPQTEGKHPFFVCINFRDHVPDK